MADAAERGAIVRTRTRLVSARREGEHWIATIESEDDGAAGHGTSEVHARVLVNAGGPWVADVLQRAGNSRNDRAVRLIKGSHLVLPRLYEGDHAFMLQNPDRRIVFVIPYEGEFSLVGTTDEPWTGAPGRAEISADETRYLLDTVNRYFARAVTADDVVWSYAGIRPLYDDKTANASAVTRDYVLDLDAPDGAPPMLSIFGGKITTYRKLAEHAMAQLTRFFPAATGAWTAGATLPGGDFVEFDAYLAELAQARPAIPAALLRRLVRAYGTDAATLVPAGASLADLGEDLGGGLTTREVDHLRTREWARTAEDILYRRSKLGLHVPAGTAARVDAYLASATGAGAAA